MLLVDLTPEEMDVVRHRLSVYDTFYIASKEITAQQIETAAKIGAFASMKQMADRNSSAG